MAIRGRGSSRTEEQKPPHLQEQLHVLVALYVYSNYNDIKYNENSDNNDVWTIININDDKYDND